MAIFDASLKGVLSDYDAARLEFEVITNEIAQRLASGEALTSRDILRNEDAHSQLSRARQEVLLAFQLYRHN